MAWDDIKTVDNLIKSAEWNDMTADQKLRLLNITGESVGDLSDVTITTVASGELLKWNGTAWVNNTLAEADVASATNLSSHTDDSTIHRLIDDESYTSTNLLSGEKITNDHKKYSGFENRTDSSIAMNGNNFEITTVSGYNVWINETGKKTINDTLSVEITEDQNITYVYLDVDGNGDVRINKSTTAWDISDGTNVPLAIVFKDGTTYAITDERHGYNRDIEWHAWAHNNIGAVYNRGLAGTFTDTTLSITQGVIYDEDIKFDTGETKTTTSLWYRNATDGMRLVRDSTTPYSYIGSNIQWDDGSGTLAEVGNNNYYTSWVYASNDSSEPIYTVIGQGNHNNLNDARNEAQPIINLSTAEWKLLYKVIYRNTSTPTFIEAQDFRSVQTGVPTQTVSPTSHSILTDRDATNSHPATAIQYDETYNVAEKLDLKLENTEINTLYQPDGTNGFVYTDNSGTLHIDGNITQSGDSYETHAEQIYTTKDFIITRDGAEAGLSDGEISGMQVLKYDGTNDLLFGTENTGFFKVGESGSLQILATREDSPTDGHFMYYDSTTFQLKGTALTKSDITDFSDGDYEVPLAFSTGLTRATNTITTNDSEINHNSLNNYNVAEHRVINDSGTGVTDLWSANKINSELDDKAETANAKGYVNHGTTADTARPSGYASIEWFGSVEPDNMEDGDTWIDTSEESE